jgi:hypothetical protein
LTRPLESITSGIHDIHYDLLRLAATDPLPSQRTDDSQLPALIVDSQEEYGVDEIIQDHLVRRGRGHQHQTLVKLVGYAKPTWQLVSTLIYTAAWALYQAIAAPSSWRGVTGPAQGQGSNI